MGLDHDEPEHAGNRHKTPAVPRRPLRRAVRAPFTLKAARILRQLEMAFALSTRFAIAKSKPIIFQPAFHAGRSRALIESENTLGLLHQTQQPK